MYFPLITTLHQFVSEETKTQKDEMTYLGLQVKGLGPRFDSIA